MLTRLRAKILKVLHRPVYFDSDFSDRQSQDQKNILLFLTPHLFTGKSILHVGIRNSEIAKRFSSYATFIDGITIVKREKRKAEKLNLSNYKVYIKNKYRKFSLGKKYDIIIDNNLASYGCCEKHIRDIFESYANMLNNKEMIITEIHGLQHHFEGVTKGFDYQKLKKISSEFSLFVNRIGSMYVIKKI